MRDFKEQKGFIRFIVLFIILIVFIAMFDIDVKAIIESAFVQEIIYYIKVVLQFVYDAFNKVIGSIKSGDTDILDIATTTMSITSPSL